MRHSTRGAASFAVPRVGSHDSVETIRRICRRRARQHLRSWIIAKMTFSLARCLRCCQLRSSCACLIPCRAARSARRCRRTSILASRWRLIRLTRFSADTSSPGFVSAVSVRAMDARRGASTRCPRARFLAGLRWRYELLLAELMPVSCLDGLRGHIRSHHSQCKLYHNNSLCTQGGIKST